MRKIIFLISFFISQAVIAQTWEDTVKRIDKIVSRYEAANPGAQIAISRHGQIIYSSVKGLANLEYTIPLTTTSKIEAGSVSKQFTAAAILLLEQQGKLSVNDDIRKYVPEIRDYGPIITISHLMHHTSGLKDWGSIAELTGWPRGTKAYTNNDALYFISLQKTLNNNPGDEYIYSNSNYTLMTIIVQRVSGMSHAEFTKQFIFKPAGMDNTGWRDVYRRVVPDRATAYSKIGNGWQTNMPNENAYGHGGLLTTAEDLLKWNNFYLNGKLGTASLLAKQLTVAPLNNGRPNLYAAGLNLDSVNGWKAISHSGATAGYRANLEYFPDLGLSFAWVSNNSASEYSDISGAVRDVFVKNLLLNKAPVKNEVNANIDWKKFIPYLGAYRNIKTGNGLRLYQKENGIYSVTNGGPLPIINETTLAAGRGRIVFTSVKPRLLQFLSASGDTVFYNGVDTASTGEKSLSEYAGTYYSDETESYSYFELKNSMLFLYQRAESKTLTYSIYKDGFYFPGGDIYFERDRKGNIIRFFISISRARKVEFVKKK